MSYTKLHLLTCETLNPDRGLKPNNSPGLYPVSGTISCETLNPDRGLKLLVMLLQQLNYIPCETLNPDRGLKLDSWCAAHQNLVWDSLRDIKPR